MSNQLQITGDLKVKSLTGALTATGGVVSSVPLGTANGVATLGGDGKVPAAQLPTMGSSYKGTWNAATNTPTIADGVGTAGDYYLVSTGGTFNGVVYVAGNTIIYSGTVWQKAGGGSGTVTSVALSAPAAFYITGSPITSAGTLAIAGAGTTNDYIKGDGTLGLFSTAAVASITGGASTIASSNLTVSRALNSDASGKVVVNTTTATELGYLSGVTSAVQTQLNSKQVGLNGTGFVKATGTTISYDNSTYYLASNPSGYTSNLGTVTSVAALTLGTAGTDVSSSVANGTTTPVITLNIPTASALNRGALSSTDWTTFNNKQNTISLTANQAVSTNSSGALVANITTATELAYLNGVTSNVQTQLNSKGASYTLGSVTSSPTSVLTITGSGAPVNGSLTFTVNQASSGQNGYLSFTDWNTFNNKQNVISLTANQAVSTGSGGQLVANITTATELAYLSGVTSNVQTQLNSKGPSYTLGSVSSSPTSVMTITGSGAPVNGSLTFTINQSSSSANGYLSSTDWTTFNNKGNRIVASPNQAVATNSSSQYVTSITTATELAYLSGVSGPVQTQLDSKAASFTLGSVSGSPGGVLSVTGSGGVVNGSLTITLTQASASTSGYLSSADWNTFNNSSTGSYLPLAGGSLTGSLTINDGNQLNLGQGGSSNVPIDFFGSNFGAGYEGRIMGLNADGNTHFYSRNGSASFTDIGYFDSTGMYITYYGSYSDIRLKDVIETNPNIDLDGIDVIKYTLKSNPSLVRYGYSAQQVQSVLPDLVTLNKRIDGNNEDATLMLNYNDLYVLKIAALEKKLTELSQEVAKLKGSNN
jgi:phage-related protein